MKQEKGAHGTLLPTMEGGSRNTRVDTAVPGNARSRVGDQLLFHGSGQRPFCWASRLSCDLSPLTGVLLPATPTWDLPLPHSHIPTCHTPSGFSAPWGFLLLRIVREATGFRRAAFGASQY